MPWKQITMYLFPGLNKVPALQLRLPRLKRRDLSGTPLVGQKRILIPLVQIYVTRRRGRSQEMEPNN